MEGGCISYRVKTQIHVMKPIAVWKTWSKHVDVTLGVATGTTSECR